MHTDPVPVQTQCRPSADAGGAGGRRGVTDPAKGGVVCAPGKPRQLLVYKQGVSFEF